MRTKQIKQQSTKTALKKTRKAFNPTVKVKIAVSPAHLSVLGRVAFGPLREAAALEKKSRKRLRPATKALESADNLKGKARARKIVEWILSRVARAELDRLVTEIRKTTPCKKCKN